MAIAPTHHRLNNTVQVGQTDDCPHRDTPPDQLFNTLQLNAEDCGLVGVRHASSLIPDRALRNQPLMPPIIKWFTSFLSHTCENPGRRILLSSNLRMLIWGCYMPT